MSLSNATEQALAQYMFEGTNPAWHSATELDIHLHTADPTDAGASTASEATYTGYAIKTVNRASSDWSYSSGETNDNLIQFDPCSGGSNTLTHWSVTPEGSTVVLVAGELTTPLNVSTGVTPQFPATDITVVFD